MHGGGVAGRDAPAHPQPDGLRGHHLDEARLVVVGLVAVDVDPQPLVGREVEGELDRKLAILARQLVMRDGADHVHPQVDRSAHQVLPAVKGHDPLLGKRHQLQRHLVADLLAQLDEGAHGFQLRVTDVDVAAHELDAVGQLPAEHGTDALLDILDHVLNAGVVDKRHLGRAHGVHGRGRPA